MWLAAGQEAAKLKCCQCSEPTGRAGWHSLPGLWGRRVTWVHSSRCGSKVGWACGGSCLLQSAAVLSPFSLCLLKCDCKQPVPAFCVGLSLLFLLTRIFPSACQLLIAPNSGLMTFLCLRIVLYLHNNRALWKAWSNVSSGSGVRQFKVPGMSLIKLVPLCCEVWRYWSRWK